VELALLCAVVRSQHSGMPKDSTSLSASSTASSPVDDHTSSFGERRRATNEDQPLILNVQRSLDGADPDESPGHRRNTALGLWLMVTSSLFYSWMTLLVKVGSNMGIPSFQLVFARSILQLVFGLAACAGAKVQPFGPKENVGWMFARGLFGSMGLAANFYSVTVMNLGDATTIFFTSPIFTALFAWIFLGEAFTGALVVASVLSLTGVVLVARPAFLFGDSAEPSSDMALAGAGAALGAAILAAIAYVIVRKVGTQVHFLVNVVWFGAVSSAVTPFAAFLLQTQDWPRGWQWEVLLGVGLTAFLGQCCLASGLQLAPAGPGTVMRNLDVVFAYVYQLLLLHDAAQPLSILGAALVVLSALFLGLAKFINRKE